MQKHFKENKKSDEREAQIQCNIYEGLHERVSRIVSLCHFPVENVPMIVSMYILLPLMDSSACISYRNIHTSWRSKCPCVSILSSLRGRAGLAAHNTHPSVVVPKILKSLINCNYLRSTNHRFFFTKTAHIIQTVLDMERLCHIQYICTMAY